MRIKEFIETLNQYDPDIEIVIDVDGNYVTPILKKSVVNFKHDYSGMCFKDDAIILSEK